MVTDETFVNHFYTTHNLLTRLEGKNNVELTSVSEEKFILEIERYFGGLIKQDIRNNKIDTLLKLFIEKKRRFLY